MDSPWVIIVIGLAVVALTVLTVHFVSNNPRIQLHNYLFKIERTHKHQLKELYRLVHVRVQQISDDELPAMAMVQNRNGDLISVRSMLEGYGQLVCEQRVAREHLDKLKHSGFRKEAEQLRIDTYDAILAQDLHPQRQLSREEYQKDPERITHYEDYISAIHAEFKYRN